MKKYQNKWWFKTLTCAISLVAIYYGFVLYSDLLLAFSRVLLVWSLVNIILK